MFRRLNISRFGKHGGRNIVGRFGYRIILVCGQVVKIGRSGKEALSKIFPIAEWKALTSELVFESIFPAFDKIFEELFSVAFVH